MLTMPIFFASDALYSTSNFPTWLKTISYINPLNYLVDGLRYFLIGDDFMTMGTHYVYSAGDIWQAFFFLVGFVIVMYFVAMRTFKKSVIT